MAITSNHFIVILCGGTGPRLWPLSNTYRPKQFLNLFGNKSLLEQTFYRAKKICSSKNIYIVSNIRYQEKITEILGKKISKSNFLFEPSKKNTTMAIIYALAYIQKINPKAIITTLPSDHYIKQIIRFKKTIVNANKLASRHHQIITIGIKPTFANPSFGYILPQQKNKEFSNINSFIEKPDSDTAKNLINKGALWNSGIYTFLASDMISEIEKLQPQYFSLLQKLITTNYSNFKSISHIYNQSLELPIDRSISEKSNNMCVIPSNFDWNDVGEWKSIHQNKKNNELGIGIISSNTEYLSFNSKNCLLNGPKGKLIGLVGVNNLAIIDTDDSLLICNLDQSSNVRDLVTQMVKNKKTKKYFIKNK